MKNKLNLPIILLFCLTMILAGCGGGSTGTSSAPGGVNTGVPTSIKLLPLQYIAQTNSFITLRARVLDGNGAAVPNYPVNFTNLSLTGVLSAVTANTNSQGNAEVRLFSSTPGFATIVAQVTGGSGTVRDRKTVYFSTNDVLVTSMRLDVNSVPGNSTYNEINDYILFQDPPIVPQPDDTFEVLATIFDGGGVPVGGGLQVWWGTSHSEAGFVRAETETNVYGQAKAVIQVSPASIRNTETHLNVTAYAYNGSANMVTLFLQPVVVSAGASSLTANPQTVAPGGASELTAVVKLNTGAVAPDGTTVNFTTTCGTVTPFGQTSGGVAPGTFTAPVTEGTCTVTAKVQGVVIGSVPILVTNSLSVFPGSATVNGITGGTAKFTVTGGSPAYSITSSDPAKAAVSPSTVAASGGTFTATVPAGTPNGTVTIQVRDAAGATVTATVTITNTALTVFPTTVSVAAGSNSSPVTVTGGTAPYAITSSDTTKATVSASTVAASGGTFTIHGVAAGTATVQVRDAAGATASVAVTVTGAGGGTFQIVPPSQTISYPGTTTATYTIMGGTAPFTPYSSNPSLVTVAVAATTLTATVSGVPSGPVTLTVYDATGASATATLTVTGAAPLAVTPASITLTGFNEPPVTAADNVDFNITGGVPPYSMYSDNSAIIASAGALAGAGFQIDPTAVASSTAVKLTIKDSVGTTASATVTVTPSPTVLGLSPSSISVTPNRNVDLYILNGITGGFDLYTSDNTCVTIPAANLPAGTQVFTVHKTVTAGCSATITLVSQANGQVAISTVGSP